MSDAVVPPAGDTVDKKTRRLTFKGASKLLGRVIGTTSRAKPQSKTSSNDGEAAQEMKNDNAERRVGTADDPLSDNSRNMDKRVEELCGPLEGNALQEITGHDVEVDHEYVDGASQSPNGDLNRIVTTSNMFPSDGDTLDDRIRVNSPSQTAEHAWHTEKMSLQKQHANERAILVEENISLKRMLDTYDKASGGQLNFKATYDELTHMRAKVGILEGELVNTHVVLEKLQRDVELLHSRLMIERDERGHLEQYYKEKIHQYVEYLESKHFLSRENMSAELGAAAVLSVDDFLRLSAESDPLAVRANLAVKKGSLTSAKSRGRNEENNKRANLASSLDDDGERSNSSRSDSPFGHRGWRTMNQELDMYATKNARNKKTKEKIDGPTTNLIIMAEKFDTSSTAEHKFKVTHKCTSPDLKLAQPAMVTQSNILESPPSLKQSIGGPLEDYVRPVGRGRNCAVHEPEYGTVFIEPNHQVEYCGEGENVNTKLVKKYEKMGHWASFTSSAKFKLKPAMEPIIGSRGLDDGPFFKLK